MNVKDLKIGDRVRMVQTRSTGFVADEPYASSEDGGLRVPVRWDGSEVTTGWSPAFLRPDSGDPAADPDEVRDGDLVRRRGRMAFDGSGLLIVVRDGFARDPLRGTPG